MRPGDRWRSGGSPRVRSSSEASASFLKKRSKKLFLGLSPDHIRISIKRGITMDDEKKPETEVLKQPSQPDEVGGPKGPEPTRYGDWEHKGRCIDF